MRPGTVDEPPRRSYSRTLLVRWLSGRKQRFAKAPYPKRVPRVRIPPSPPFAFSIFDFRFSILRTRSLPRRSLGEGWFDWWGALHARVQIPLLRDHSPEAKRQLWIIPPSPPFAFSISRTCPAEALAKAGSTGGTVTRQGVRPTAHRNRSGTAGVGSSVASSGACGASGAGLGFGVGLGVVRLVSFFFFDFLVVLSLFTMTRR